VGIGASAGGLKALGRFLKHVPNDSRMAFVVVQHLDPTHLSKWKRTFTFET
jgi:two-component system CheB/CheR fusion protein